MSNDRVSLKAAHTRIWNRWTKERKELANAEIALAHLLITRQTLEGLLPTNRLLKRHEISDLAYNNAAALQSNLLDDMIAKQEGIASRLRGGIKYASTSMKTIRERIHAASDAA